MPLIFSPGSKPKKGIPLLDQGYVGRVVPPIFTPGSKPKKGTLYYNFKELYPFLGVIIKYTLFWLLTGSENWGYPP